MAKKRKQVELSNIYISTAYDLNMEHGGDVLLVRFGDTFKCGEFCGLIIFENGDNEIQARDIEFVATTPPLWAEEQILSRINNLER